MIVVPDPLSARTFFDCGVLDKLTQQNSDFVVVFTGDRYDYKRWTENRPEIEYVDDSAVDAERKLSVIEKVYRYIDRRLDAAFGWYPIAIRFNLKHGFHAERMAPDHNNSYLNLSLMGPLPHWNCVFSTMFAWVFNRTRYLETSINNLVKHRASYLVLANLQAPRMYKYVVAARRHNVPIVAYIASWDHTVGKGVVYPKCIKYLVQNYAMSRDLVDFHNIKENKVVVTGWPQTDIFARARSSSEYKQLIESYGLDTSKKVIFVTGNTKTNTPYEPQFLEHFLAWLRASDIDASVVFRPHPKDKGWRKRFSNIDLGQSDFHCQSPSYVDVEDLACLLQHVDCVVTHAGTILLDSIVNGRPAVCVVYDEAADGDVKYADKNVIGKHYQDLLNSGSFVIARSLDEVAGGVRKMLSEPALLEQERRTAAEKIVGKLDGRSAERVVHAICQCVNVSKPATHK